MYYGFESGDFTGWTVSPVPQADVVINHTGYCGYSANGAPYAPVAGTKFARLKELNGATTPKSISRTFFLAAGESLSGYAALDWGDELPYWALMVVSIVETATELLRQDTGAQTPNCHDYPWTSWIYTAPADGTYTVKCELSNASYIYTAFALLSGITLITAGDPITPTAPLALTVHAAAVTPAAALRLEVYESALLGAHTCSATVTFNGIDITARIAGTITVEIEEGAARIADLDWLPPAGALTLGDLVGTPLIIDVAHDSGGIATVDRLFTGRIETPTIDLASGLIHLIASDGLQKYCDALSTAVIAVLLPDSHWSRFLFDPLAAGLAHAQDRLATWPGNLDLDAHGQPRTTAWAAAIPYRTLTEAHIADVSLAVELVDRGRLVNQVSIAWGYRFPRLALRRARFEWDMEVSTWTNHPGQTISANPNDPDYRQQTMPDVAMIEEAAKGGGWTLHADSDYTLNPDRYPNAPGVAIWQVVSCDLRLDLRYAQTLSEAYTLTVRAPNSIATAGLLNQAAQYSGTCDFAADAWEKDATLAPVLTPPVLTGETTAAGDLGDTGRAEANAAILTALRLARAKILGSHRHRLSCTVPFDPWLDVDRTVSVATARVTATGKLGRVAHRLDMDAGRFTSEITLRPSGIAPALPPVTETPLTAPAQPGKPAPDLTGVSLRGWMQYAWAVDNVIDPPDAAKDGYISHQPSVGYNGRFQITAPAIPDADRAALDLTTSATYDIAIPEDGLTLTA